MLVAKKSSDVRKSLARFLALACAVAIHLGCDDDDAVSHSGDIGIKVNLNQNDVSPQDVLSDGKNITTEAGNPCGTFTQDARDVLGRDPSAIRVNRVSLELGPNPRDVTTLEDLWSGQVTITIVVDGNILIPIAQGPVGATTGPVNLALTDSRALMDANIADIVNCNYEVRVSGDKTPGLDPAFDAEVTITVNLSALP